MLLRTLPTFSKCLTYLALASAFFVGSTVVLATTGDVQPKKTEKKAEQKAEQKAEPEKTAVEAASAKTEVDLSVCDEEGNEISYNTLEDLMAISRGDLDAIAKLAAGGRKPAAEGQVQWREVEPASDPAAPAKQD